jgi:chemotaxis protein histidine kinase CheA
VPAIAGSAILGNGRVALILDVSGLMREVIRLQARGAPADTSLPSAVVTQSLRPEPTQYH